MDRSIVYSGEVPRSYDHLKAWTRTALGAGFLYNDLIGGTTTNTSDAYGIGSWKSIPALSNLSPDLGGQTAQAAVNTATGFVGPFFASGFGVSYPVVSGIPTFAVDAGTIYVAPSLGMDALSAVPGGTLNFANSLAPGGTNVATDFGDLTTPNPSVVPLQVIVPAAALALAQPAAGKFNAYIIEVVPWQQDRTDTDDPNYSAGGGTVPGSAILPFYNSASPTTPLAGPGGSTPPTSSQTDRQCFGQLRICSAPVIGDTVSAAHAAAAVQADAGAIPLFLVVLSNANANQVPAQSAGLGAYALGLGTCPTLNAQLTGYKAPFLRGLTNQHHLGVPGSAPQIDGSVEWLPTAAVPNNNKGFINFNYLQAGAGTGYITPSVAAGAVAAVTGAGSAVVGTACSQSSGDIRITFSTAVNAFGAGPNQLYTIPYTTAGAPIAIIMTLRGTTQSWAAAAGMAACSLLADASGGLITFYLNNQSGGGLANTANGVLRFGYIVLY